MQLSHSATAQSPNNNKTTLRELERVTLVPDVFVGRGLENLWNQGSESWPRSQTAGKLDSSWTKIRAWSKFKTTRSRRAKWVAKRYPTLSKLKLGSSGLELRVPRLVRLYAPPRCHCNRALGEVLGLCKRTMPWSEIIYIEGFGDLYNHDSGSEGLLVASFRWETNTWPYAQAATTQINAKEWRTHISQWVLKNPSPSNNTDTEEIAFRTLNSMIAHKTGAHKWKTKQFISKHNSFFKNTILYLKTQYFVRKRNKISENKIVSLKNIY